MTPLTVISFVVYVISSLTTIGMLFDNSQYAPIFELLRCMLLVTIIQKTNFITMKDSLLIGSEVFFVISGLFWFLQCCPNWKSNQSTPILKIEICSMDKWKFTFFNLWMYEYYFCSLSLSCCITLIYFSNDWFRDLIISNIY